MHMPEASVRFGLMLEAYCRGAVGHMKSLLIQVRMTCSYAPRAHFEKLSSEHVV